MMKNTQWIRKVNKSGENFFEQLKNSGMNISQLAESIKVSRHMLKYDLFHVKQKTCSRLIKELKVRGNYLILLADELELLLK